MRAPEWPAQSTPAGSAPSGEWWPGRWRRCGRWGRNPRTFRRCWARRSAGATTKYPRPWPMTSRRRCRAVAPRRPPGLPESTSQRELLASGSNWGARRATSIRAAGWRTRHFSVIAGTRRPGGWRRWSGSSDSMAVQRPAPGSGSDRETELTLGLASVRSRLAVAAEAAGRNVTEIELLPVTKFFPATDVAILSRLGCRAVGESRDQEASAKVTELARLGAASSEADSPELRWHMVGRLQRN